MSLIPMTVETKWPPVSGASPKRFASTEIVAGAWGSAAARLLNNIIGQRRRLLYTAHQVAEVVYGGTPPRFAFWFRTSPFASRIRIRMGCMPSDTVSTSDTPTATWNLLDGWSGESPTGVTPRAIPVGRRRSSSSDAPNDYFWLEEIWDESEIEPGRWYRTYLDLADNARVFSVTAWEEPSTEMTSSNLPAKRGTGDSLTLASEVFTLVDSAALFTADDVGRRIYILGSTDDSNNGSYVISTVEDDDEITFAAANDASGSTEDPWTGRWMILPQCVNPRRYVAGSEITDADLAHLWDATELMWIWGGGRLADWFGESLRNNSSTWVNVFDTSWTTATTKSPGWWIWTEGLGTHEAPDVVKCKLWIWGSAAASPGGEVRLLRTDDGSGTALGTFTSFATGQNGYRFDVELPVSATPIKLDLQMRMTVVGDFEVTRVLLLQYEGG